MFEQRSQIDWITSHIKAEVSHHQEVADANFGMSCLAQSKTEQDEYIRSLGEYAALWSNALMDFYHAI